MPVEELLKSTLPGGCSPEQRGLLPLIFDLSIRKSLRETREQKARENVWLQLFFSRLASCMSLDFEKPANAPIEEGSVVALKTMLRSAISHNVFFNGPLITKILAQTSGLAHGDVVKTVDWELIGLCMELDPGTMIKATIRSTTATRRTSEPEDTLLDSLLETLTRLGSRSASAGATNALAATEGTQAELLGLLARLQWRLDLVLMPLLKNHARLASFLAFCKPGTIILPSGTKLGRRWNILLARLAITIIASGKTSDFLMQYKSMSSLT